MIKKKICHLSQLENKDYFKSWVKEFKDEIILVNFFATWCKPCRDEHVYIMRFTNEKNIRVIGINYKDNDKKTIKWLKDLGNPYSDVLIDGNGRIANRELQIDSFQKTSRPA